MEGLSVDIKKYEDGRYYAQRYLYKWKKESVFYLINSIDSAKDYALKNKDAFSLGLADQLWDWVLEKKYIQAVS
jgi:hypothetical protein